MKPDLKNKGNHIRSLLAKQIVQLWDRLQQKFATTLSRYASKYSRRKLTALLVLFALVYLGCLGYTTLHAIGDAQPVQRTITRQKAQNPAPVSMLIPAGLPSNYTTHQICLFQQYIDSLRVHDPPAYHDFCRQHAGLIDSLDMLQSFHSSSINKLQHERVNH